MKTLYGITNLAVKTIDQKDDDLSLLNKFIEEHDGNIVEIQSVVMLYGWTRYVVVYRKETVTT